MMNKKTRLVKEKTGMNLKDLAKEFGYAEASLTKALRGHNSMGYSLAKLLAQRTGMSPLYFLENESEDDQ